MSDFEPKNTEEAPQIEVLLLDLKAFQDLLCSLAGLMYTGFGRKAGIFVSKLIGNELSRSWEQQNQPLVHVIHDSVLSVFYLQTVIVNFKK